MLGRFFCIVLLMASSLTFAEEPLLYQIDEITTEELVSWYEQQIEMVVLDARGRRYFNGHRLPGALWTSCSAPDDAIFQAVPNKDSLIVVYCSNIDCPASNWLSARLLKLGYIHVYEYPLGIDGWMEAGLPTDKVSP